MQRAEQEIVKASDRYEKAIAELKAAREAMDDEATLRAWLSGGDGGNAANDALGGRGGSQALSFTRTLEALREDRAHLVAHLATVTNPAPVAEPRMEFAWTSKGW